MDKEKKIKVLQDIIKMRTVNENEMEVINYLKDLLAEYGIESKVVKNTDTRGNLVVEYGKDNGPILAYSGHVDVVSPGDEEKWDFGPFDATITDGKLYGRGATDMKAGTMAICLALIELKEKNVELDGKIRLLITCAEEVSMIGAEKLTEEGYVDDIDGLVIAEPTQYNLVPAHKGSILYEIESKGKSAHSSAPEQGINALTNLLEFYNEFKTTFDKMAETRVDDVLGETFNNVTIAQSGDQPNTLPDYAIFKGSIRNTPSFSNEEIEGLFKELTAKYNAKEGFDISFKFLNNALPAKGDFNSDLMQVIQGLSEKRSGNKMPELAISGTTDASRFFKTSNTFDFVVFGPGEPFLAHQINEFVTVDNYLDMIDYFQEISKKYLAMKK